MGLGRDSRERALKAVVSGDGFWLGIATRQDGDSLIEVRDPNYRRAPILFGDPKHHDRRTEIANVKAVTFNPWLFDCEGDLRYWFVVKAASGGQPAVATGRIAPRGYIVDRAVLSPGDIEVKSKAFGSTAAAWAQNVKDTAPKVWPRPLAGEELIFRPGDIMLFITEQGDDQ